MLLEPANGIFIMGLGIYNERTYHGHERYLSLIHISRFTYYDSLDKLGFIVEAVTRSKN